MTVASDHIPNLQFSHMGFAVTDMCKGMCKEQPGFEPYADWRKRFAAKMNRFVPNA